MQALSPSPSLVSRQDMDEVNRRLAYIERLVSADQIQHYRHGVEINSTRGRMRFLFDGERRRASELSYDLQELLAGFESLNLRRHSLKWNGVRLCPRGRPESQPGCHSPPFRGYAPPRALPPPCARAC